MKLSQQLLLIFTALTLFMLTPPLHATENKENSLEWQRVNLEERFQTVLQKAIESAVTPAHFVTSVNIELKEIPKKPKPTPTPSPTPSSTLNSNLNLDNRIFLGKLDIDAPIFKPDSQMTPAPTLDQSTEPELNLFKLIKKVSVNILLDTQITSEKKSLVEKIVKSSLASLDPTLLNLKIDQADLSAPKEQKDLKQWLIEFKLPIGFLLATFMMSLLSLILFLGYRSLEFRKLALMAEQGVREQTRLDATMSSTSPGNSSAQTTAESGATAASGANNLAAVTGSHAILGGKASGFEKFSALLKETPDKAARLIQQWIKAPTKESREALSALLQVLSTEEFLLIFQHLPLEDRKTWRRILSTTSGTENLEAASQYISSEIINTFLTPAPEMNDELKALMDGLEVSQAVEIANSNVELGGILMNLLPTAVLSQFYATLSTDLANKITVEGLKFSSASLTQKTSHLKEAIQQVKNKTKSSSIPFLEKANELFHQITPDKEQSIFNALAETNQYALLQATAQRFFPSELVLELPETLLKTCLERFSLQKRADFLISCGEAEQSTLINILAKTGTKARDLLDLEIQQALSDTLRSRRAKKMKETLWKEFLNQIRTRIRGNDLASDQAEPILNAWLYKKTNGQIGSLSDTEATQIVDRKGNNGNDTAQQAV